MRKYKRNPANKKSYDAEKEREIYNMYQRAQKPCGYLLIGIKGIVKNGKQVIVAYPGEAVSSGA